MRRVLAVTALGCVLFFFVGLVHIAGSVRLFGADGPLLPGWVVVVLAPLVLFVDLTLLQAWQIARARRRQRRATRRA